MREGEGMSEEEGEWRTIKAKIHKKKNANISLKLADYTTVESEL